MSGYEELPLLDLFKEEVRSQVESLEAGLVELEQAPTNPQLIEPLMRAAHSIKGAARVVGVDLAVGLAHIMEECLVRAQRGTITLNAFSIDALLAGVDSLHQIANAAGEGFEAWALQHQPKVDELKAKFEKISAGQVLEVATAAQIVEATQTPTSAPKPAADVVAPTQPDLRVVAALPTPVPEAVVVPAENSDSVRQAQARLEKLTAEIARGPFAETTPAEPTISSLPEDSPLLDLYRIEAEAKAKTLMAALPSLETHARDAHFIEPLVNAAKNIASTARIVFYTQIGDLAASVEQTLAAILKGKLKVEESVNALFDAVVLIEQSAVPESGGNQSTRNAASELAQVLKSLAPSDEPSQATSLPTTTPVAQLTQAVTQPAIAIQKVEPVAQTPSQVVESQTHHPATTLAQNDLSSPKPVTPVTEATPVPNSKPPAKPATLDEKERVVRITAQSLTRLMGLAGESLVEARWLQPFSQSLLMLRRQQDHLADVIEELSEQLSRTKSDRRALDLILDARQQVGHCRHELTERIDEFETHARQSDDLNSRLYHEVITSRMRPFGDGVHGFPRMVRDLARQLGKNVHFELLGQRTNVDREILEKLEAPLTHLIRNAVDHGLDTPTERLAAGKSEHGRIVVEARHAAGMLSITISDDGRGVDLDRLRQKIIEKKLQKPDIVKSLNEKELLDFLFLPGFSTAEKVTDVSGRGVGLDVVHSTIYAVGGNLKITTKKGLGTTFHLMLPITLSVLRAVLCDIGGEPYAFPHNRIERLIKLPRSSVRSLEYRQYFEVDGRNVGLVQAQQVLHLDGAESDDEELSIVLFGNDSRQYGLIVDAFRSEQDLVVRPLDARLGKVPNISSAAILEDGSPVLIVDIEDLTRSIEKLINGERLRRVGHKTKPNEQRRKRVLVVDDSITVREVERQLLTSHGYEVEVAVDGADGWNAVRDGQFDLVVSDVDMPRMNGFDFVNQIKSDPRLQATPVIIVSYKDREEDKLRGLQVGANYYLTKSSFHDESLINAVEVLIGTGKA